MGQDSRWPPRGPLQLTGVVGGTLVALPGGTSELGGAAATEPVSCRLASRSAHLLRTAPITRGDQV